VAIVAEERSIHIDGDHADGAGFGFGLQATHPPTDSDKAQ
jgi:hypothetical protein